MSKKKKNPENTFVNSILTIFAQNPFTNFNYRQISGQLGIKDKPSQEMIRSILEDLEREKTIYQIKKGKYQLNPKSLDKFFPAQKYVTGTVDMKQTGKAYLICEDCEEDVYIASNNTNHALDGDTAKVLLFPKRKGRKTEGQIVEIIKRGRKQFVGIVQVSKNFAFLIPDNTSVTVDIFIPLSELNGARNGQKAVAIITDWPERSNHPFGKITNVLGDPGENNVEMNAILADFDFPLSFPEAVEKEVKKISLAITTEEIKKRRDFRNTPTFTIDPADAKDFDDALSLRKLKNGNWEVGIHIADVSHYVGENSLTDLEAKDRGTSIYLVDRVVPMLPEKLSNEVCSLKPYENKLCYSAVFQMNNDASVLNQWFGRTVINSNRRFNYDEAQKVLDTGKGDMKEELLQLHQLAQKLRDERFRNGSIAFESTEVKFHLDTNGKPIGVYIKEPKDSNFLIEEFMLLANRKVAEFIGKKKNNENPQTFVYRIHDQPNPDKLSSFIQFISKLGYSMKINSSKTLATSFNQLFRKIHGRGEQNLIETLAVRTMAKAIYSTDNIGHYGLSFSYYTHFTSPIRRYPDLIVHRLLTLYLQGKPSANTGEYEQLCDHSSDMERRAAEAERASVKYKQAEFLMDKIGQEFDAQISGVSKWGLFVELSESKCEGMVSMRNMVDDLYYLDEENYQVIGHRTGKIYRLGDPLKVMVKGIDLAKKQIDFVMVQ